MAKVHWTKQARNELIEICDYIARDSIENADRVLERVLEAPKILATFPFQGWVVPEYQIEVLREILVGKLRVIYRIRQDDVFVMAIIHGRRDLLRSHAPEDFEPDD